MAYTLSRVASAYLRTSYLRNQAVLFADLVAEYPGDKSAYAQELQRKMEELELPIDIVYNSEGKRPSLNHSLGNLLINGQSVERELDHGQARLIVGVRPNPNINIVNWFTFAILLLALVGASALSVVLLFSGFRERAELAKSVFVRIQRGDLKARFPISRWDEFGQVPLLFNQMAAEIERLVDQLKAKEKARVHLLQELTHDLRTPVSSLRNLVETLRFNKSDLQPEAEAEITDLAYQETEYLTRLVEDLLFLALVLEPKYKSESGAVDLNELLGEQMNVIAKSYPRVKFSLPRGPNLRVTGHPQQLRRLVRNALDNAFSFARGRVDVAIEDSDDGAKIAIRDDGPGFSEESLKSFGHKRATRYQTAKEKDRLSVGLGSVIMSAIVHSHGGRLVAENRAAEDGEVLGSQITITLADSPGMS